MIIYLFTKNDLFNCSLSREYTIKPISTKKDVINFIKTIIEKPEFYNIYNSLFIYEENNKYNYLCQQYSLINNKYISEEFQTLYDKLKKLNIFS